MCGINGFYNYGSSSIPDAKLLVGKMNDTLVHRGPDDSGVWSSHGENITLGHRRLSILDLSARGHQPMHGNHGSTIVFNGEIYNFRELRKEFSAESFSSDSDTEVLLCLYERKGQSCLDDLNGMFAFAIWDDNSRKLFLARDRIGIKPLYYTTMGGVFSFSSEIKSLLVLPWVKAKLDEEALYHYLTFNNVPHPQTMFSGISKLEPGYCMVVGGHGIEQHRQYWEAEYSDYSRMSDSDLQEQVLAQLRASVERRMVSDVPVGAFLSGGVDSSAIVGLMSEFSNQPVKTYSIGFDGAPGYDEREYARQISRRFNTDHYERIVTRQDIVDFLPGIVDIYDEPLADATSIPINFISALARENGSTVVLTGDGADEEFFGYSHWMPYLTLGRYFDLLSSMPSPIRKLVAGLTSCMDENRPAFEIINRACNRQEFFWGGAGGLKESAKQRILSPAYKERMKDVDIHMHVALLKEKFLGLNKGGDSFGNADWMSYTGVKEIIPNFYLYRADRLGMAHSIELRVPFLDHEVVNLALSIPGERKLINGEPKGVLKKALESLLPEEILYRKKVGFCVPLDIWLKDIMAENVESRLTAFCDDTGLFDRQAIAGLVNQCKSGNSNVVHILWNLYFLINWHARWIN
jgi:asparagine synthase (glutamine-hydrolysing)